MKYLVRVLLFNLFGLWLTSQILPTLKIASGWATLILAGIIFSLLLTIVKPVLRILFIPINLLTLGLASWFINVILLYLLTIFVPAVEVVPWTFPGATGAGFVIPPIYLNYPVALIVSAIFVTFVVQLLHETSEG
ncbi:MAG: phage holin family protein [Patescibacteria group bacterium]